MLPIGRKKNLVGDLFDPCLDEDRSVVLRRKGWEVVVMVCQAASQTRFRALKHENGIAGSATIIVRIIACFQPLQDCQVSG